jgi:hypothetical protein
MEATATDCDFMFRIALESNVMQRFLANPNGMTDLVHCFARDEVDVYDEVDVSKRSELQQDRKIVVITGAGRGIGRVSLFDLRVFSIC